ncbi:calcium-binding protein [Actinoplanes aureus]|uniref:Calcium-binding protein n=1 Tax=Actinoplanes aureus TaxID=2792083 RepID=A0A931G4P7_9ACTN|nr:calcium-binding protein [Actinoplanes aureus]MBG0568171.1 calcium-binding protein [Actinoplanes aureus]
MLGFGRPAAGGIAVLTLAAVAAVTSPAQAAGTGVASVTAATKVQYKAASGKQNKVVITRSGNTITIDDKVAVTAGKGCKKVNGDKTKVRCATATVPSRVTIYTEDRNDVIVNDSDIRMSAFSGSGNDTITGGLLGDKIQAGSGNDKADGRSGKDTLWGMTGHDTLRGGIGDDQLFGFEGNDKLYGDAGADILEGGLGRDHLDGGADHDLLRGDEPRRALAADVLLGGPGTDIVSYAGYTKRVVVDTDGVKGDDGQAGEHDTVGTDVESIFGGSGNDRIVGNAGNGSFSGGEGNDVIYGGAGVDSINGGDGKDKIYGGADDDYLDGGDYETQVADLLDGGSNTSYGGDHCQKAKKDTLIGCEK